MSEKATLLLVFLSVGALTFLTFVWWRAKQRRRSLVRSLKDDVPGSRSGQLKRSRETWLVKLGRRTKKPKATDDELKMKLARAGWDSRTAPLTYSAIRLSLGVSLPVLFAVIAYSANRTQLEILTAGVAGFFLAQLIPASVLSRRSRMRQKRIRKSLPDALDLMVVCVEAGVGLDAAILRVANELHLTHPEIAYEFRVVNQRVNAGLPRVDAMREMVSRTGVADLRSVITTLIQSERLGVSIGRVLRVASDGLRTRRRQAAEQTARKAPIKMLIPLILFVLPALILVIIGPAAIHLLRVLRETAP
jgi:tight adherence protein C